MLNDSQIPAPRVLITEKEGGLITREWFRFFNFVYEQIVRLTSFAYGTFSGFETTTWASNTTTQVSITDTALSSGVSVASSQVTVANAGLYSINASFQIYCPNTTTAYTIALWARVSGVDVPGSLRYVTAPGGLVGSQTFSTHTLALTLQLPAAAYIEFYGASAGGAAQLCTIAANQNPSIPATSAASILLNVTQIA